MPAYSLVNKGKSKVFYGQEPPSGEFTATQRGLSYQLLAEIYWSSSMGNYYCSRPQRAMDNAVRTVFQLTGRTSHPHAQYPLRGPGWDPFIVPEGILALVKCEIVNEFHSICVVGLFLKKKLTVSLSLGTQKHILCLRITKCTIQVNC